MSVPFRFIHAADLHLDSPFRGFQKAPGAVRDCLIGAGFAALRRLTDTAITEAVDFIVIAGDLFDEADRSLRAQLAFVKEWRRLAEHGISVFIIHGNHDHLSGKRIPLDLPANVHIFGSDAMTNIPAYNSAGELLAHVYGMSYRERVVTDNLAASYRISEEAPFHIALLHGNVGGDQAHDPYAPCSLEELVGKDFQYWALGHIHTRQVLHEYPHVVYAGNIQGRNPRETGDKGCYLVDVSSSQELNLTFLALDTVRFHTESIDIQSIKTEQELFNAMQQMITMLYNSKLTHSIMLRIELTGSGPLHTILDEGTVLQALLNELQEEQDLSMDQYWVYPYTLMSNTRLDVNWLSLAEEDSFTGELLRLSQHLSHDKDEWQSFAQLAIQDIRSHAKLGRLGRGRWDEPPEEWLTEARELLLSALTD